MGEFFYSHRVDTPVFVDDRTLAHLQFVVGAKLRLGQPFFFSWTESVASGGGRGSVWIERSIQIRFTYASSARIRLNHQWTEQLMASANSVDGLQLAAEPAEEAHLSPPPRLRTSVRPLRPTHGHAPEARIMQQSGS
jgi:hypothetical protein